MKLIFKERQGTGEGKEAFVSEVVHETQENVNRWLSASILSERAAKEALSGEVPYRLRLMREDGEVYVSIFREGSHQIGERILYGESDGYDLEAWAMDVSLMLLYLAANYGGSMFAEGVTDFLANDRDGLMPYLDEKNLT